MTVIIERIAEPLPGARAQLVEYVFIDGEQVAELTVKRGSPAPAKTRARTRRDAGVLVTAVELS